MVILGDGFNSKNFDFDDQEKVNLLIKNWIEVAKFLIILKKGEGKASASKEDRAELLKNFYDWSIGKNADLFYVFYAHLNEHGRKDGFPFLDKDLLFCIDTIRLKV